MQPIAAPPTPGIYPGPGQAKLLRAGEYVTLLNAAAVVTNQASIAVQIERIKSGFFYPIGLSLEFQFSGAPGSFEIDIQTADTDQDAFYVKNSSITTGLNSSNVGRIELTAFWALYARIFIASLTNPVSLTARFTR